jgi:ribose 5-phosphate isomerase B
MRIALGADHGGFELKCRLRDDLQSLGHHISDLGANGAGPSDYPDFALAVAERVARAECDRGILVCTTGMGMAIAANKVRGIRAALAMNSDEVRLARAHNDANVLTIGSKYTDLLQAKEMITIFLATDFEGGRHSRRIEKIARIEGGM